jgi:hypothetical protein
MRFASTACVVTGAFVAASTFAAPPAEAGRACTQIGLGSRSIKSNDRKARLNGTRTAETLGCGCGTPTRDNAVELDAGFGNVINLFSNLEDQSNAWSRPGRRSKPMARSSHAGAATPTRAR